ncbi:MAG: phage minor capsid protein, partial [Clostridia bacterium]|nr:phage minor capsid protein [Clostridia bacterium]
MDPRDAKLIEDARLRFDAISEKARAEVYRIVMEHYQKHPGSPWSGAPLRDLEKAIKAFYEELGEEYQGEFRDTIPDVMQAYYDRAVEEMKAAGKRNAILGKPDAGRMKYFMDSSFEQVAMRTRNMSFQHIRDLRSLSADVLRQMSVTGETRRTVSKAMLSRALEISGFEFRDAANRKWQNKTYFEMLARTELMAAARGSYDDKCASEGFDVVRLTYSGDSCDDCSKWEGRLFSLTGADPSLPSKEDLQNDGVFHPNCTHSYSLVPDYIRKRDYDGEG